MSSGYILEPAHGGQLGWMKVRGYAVPYSSALSVGPHFPNLISARINKQQPCNIVVTGEPGISKTYSAITLARFLQPKTFTIKNVAMTYEEFMQGMLNFKQGEIIVFDEPEYEAGHRDWYQWQNKALVSTVRSGRFKVHPLFIPCINKRLLDKVIRDNLLQYMIHLDGRGEGTVYSILPSRFDDSIVFPEVEKIRIGLLDYAKCQKSWCYDCEEYKTCPLLRAQYERKRSEIQDKRYKEDLSTAQRKESGDSGFVTYLRRAFEDKELFYVDSPYKNDPDRRVLSVEKIELYLGCSPTMAQKLRRALKVMSREDLERILDKK